MRKNKKDRIRKWREDCWAKNEGHARYDEANQIKRKNGCRKPMVGHWIVGGRLREGVAPSRMGRHRAHMVRVVEEGEKKDEKQKDGGNASTQKWRK